MTRSPWLRAASADTPHTIYCLIKNFTLSPYLLQRTRTALLRNSKFRPLHKGGFSCRPGSMEPLSLPSRRLSPATFQSKIIKWGRDNEACKHIKRRMLAGASGREARREPISSYHFKGRGGCSVSRDPIKTHLFPVDLCKRSGVLESPSRRRGSRPPRSSCVSS